MIQLLANLIVVTALGGAVIAVALTVVKVAVSLAASLPSKVDSTVVSEKAKPVDIIPTIHICKYCGHILGEETECDFCGAVRQ